ncbi:unnamed protein product [Echinostoma caproni]|uniref:Enkurin domain-containing protein n=1 Tax=Echinostoma caproni TaxID=27848 RepID=A0A183AVR4_9TREM|nr:unnamed protein product [Echinostoma caproni]
MAKQDSVGVAPCSVDVRLNKPPIGPREYIYNLVPQPRPNMMTRYTCLPKIRQKKYEFVDNPKKEAMKTMGPPSQDRQSIPIYPEKHDYLRKQSKRPFIKPVKFQAVVCETTHEEDNLTKRKNKRCLTEAKAPLPTRKAIGDALGAQGIPVKCLNPERHKVNWITRNAISTMTQEPGFRVPLRNRNCLVDTRKGDKFPLKSNRTFSGLEPIYVYKQGMGKVPTYLSRRARLIKKTQDLLTHYVNEKALQNTDYLLTEEQREELLSGLKAAWDRYNRKYLGLASINDTMKGKTYKLYLEKQLDALKADIDLVEGHQYIFVEAPKDPNGNRTTAEKICV